MIGKTDRENDDEDDDDADGEELKSWAKSWTWTRSRIVHIRYILLYTFDSWKRTTSYLMQQRDHKPTRPCKPASLNGLIKKGLIFAKVQYILQKKHSFTFFFYFLWRTLVGEWWRFFFFFEIIYFAAKEGFWRLGREKGVQQIGIEKFFSKYQRMMLLQLVSYNEWQQLNYSNNSCLPYCTHFTHKDVFGLGS